MSAADAIEQLLGAHIQLRNTRRLQTAMRSARLPAVKTLTAFKSRFQPSIKSLNMAPGPDETLIAVQSAG